MKTISAMPVHASTKNSACATCFCMQTAKDCTWHDTQGLCFQQPRDRIHLLHQNLQLLSLICPPCQRYSHLLLMWHRHAKPESRIFLYWTLRLQGKCWEAHCLWVCLSDGVTVLRCTALKPSAAYWSALLELKLDVLYWWSKNQAHRFSKTWQ